MKEKLTFKGQPIDSEMILDFPYNLGYKLHQPNLAKLDLTLPVGSVSHTWIDDADLLRHGDVNRLIEAWVEYSKRMF